MARAHWYVSLCFSFFSRTIIFPATSDKTSYRNNGNSGGTFSDRGDNANENGSGDGADDGDEGSIGVWASTPPELLGLSASIFFRFCFVSFRSPFVLRIQL